MALDSGDLFVVQKNAGGALAKVTAQDLNSYLEASSSVTYKGTADFGASLADPANGVVNVGDLYLNSGETDGPFAWSNGPTPTPDPVNAGDRVIWNGTEWDYITSGVEDVGVESISGGVAITVRGTDANPTIDADYASESSIGVVQIATDADVAAGNVGNPAPIVVTAAQLKTTNDSISAAGGGTVTSVTAAGGSAISVTQNTTTPVVDVAVATNSVQGVMRFATDAEATAGDAVQAAVTPQQLAANVPSDVGVRTIVENADPDAVVSGAMAIEGPDGNGQVVIGIETEVFCPYDFRTLDDV